jgi:FkbM family methyltransferase
VAKSLARRALPRLSRAVVPYDDGRSSICADLHTPLGLMIYRYGHRDADPDVTADIDLCGRLLGPGDVFVDGGANVGLFTLVAAQRVGRTGKVVAFEPGRSVRLRLMENLVLNGFSQVEVVPFALSCAPGQAGFRVFEIGAAALNHLAPVDGEHGDLETVALTTLDAALIPHDRDRLTLIKLDLEGAEHDALLGAEQILRDRRPDILLEIEPTHLRRMGASAGSIGDLLSRHGYRFYRRDNNGRGTLALVAVPSVSEPSNQPNLFATVDPNRARSRGIPIR